MYGISKPSILYPVIRLILWRLIISVNSTSRAASVLNLEIMTSFPTISGSGSPNDSKCF